MWSARTGENRSYKPGNIDINSLDINGMFKYSWDAPENLFHFSSPKLVLEPGIAYQRVYRRARGVFLLTKDHASVGVLR